MPKRPTVLVGVSRSVAEWADAARIIRLERDPEPPDAPPGFRFDPRPFLEDPAGQSVVLPYNPAITAYPAWIAHDASIRAWLMRADRDCLDPRLVEAGRGGLPALPPGFARRSMRRQIEHGLTLAVGLLTGALDVLPRVPASSGFVPPPDPDPKRKTTAHVNRQALAFVRDAFDGVESAPPLNNSGLANEALRLYGLAAYGCFRDPAKMTRMEIREWSRYRTARILDIAGAFREPDPPPPTILRRNPAADLVADWPPEA